MVRKEHSTRRSEMVKTTIICDKCGKEMPYQFSHIDFTTERHCFINKGFDLCESCAREFVKAMHMDLERH